MDMAERSAGISIGTNYKVLNELEWGYLFASNKVWSTQRLSINLTAHYCCGFGVVIGEILLSSRSNDGTTGGGGVPDAGGGVDV